MDTARAPLSPETGLGMGTNMISKRDELLEGELRAQAELSTG